MSGLLFLIKLLPYLSWLQAESAGVGLVLAAGQVEVRHAPGGVRAGAHRGLPVGRGLEDLQLVPAHNPTNVRQAPCET